VTLPLKSGRRVKRLTGGGGPRRQRRPDEFGQRTGGHDPTLAPHILHAHADRSGNPRRRPVGVCRLGHLRCCAVSSLPIPIVQLDPDLPLPKYAHDGDAGMDLYAAEDATITAGGGRALVATGISIAIPLGYGGFVLPRSGMALKHGISVVNAPGLIDAAYRGEIKVILLNTDPTSDYSLSKGDRVAQLVIQKVEQVEWQVINSLDGDDRGGGFGHSGT
jgi:dUTP pyrophosphatase